MSRRLVVGGKVKVENTGAIAKASLNRAFFRSPITDPNPDDLTMTRMKLG